MMAQFQENDKAVLMSPTTANSSGLTPRQTRCGAVRRILGYVLLGLLGFLSLLGLSKEYESYVQQQRAQTTGSWAQGLGAFMSPDTIKTLESDARLRQSLLALVEVTADLSELLSAQIDSPALREASEIIHEYQAQMSDGSEGQQPRGDIDSPAIRRRQLLGGLFGGGGMDGAMGNALTGAMMSGINNIGSQLLGDLSGSGMFLGIGVGTGAAQGLNISTPDQTMQVAKKVAADNQQEATGLNPLLQNVGVGLTSSILSNVDVGSLLNGTQDQLQPIAMSLAQGLGNGTVAGLKINPMAPPMPANDSSITNVLGTFGFGLTQSVTSNIDTQALLGQLNNPENTASIMRNIPDIAKGLGQGLGEGAAVGLGLQADAPVPMRQMPDGSVDVGGVTQTFSKSLTASFLQNGTAGKLAGMIGGSMAAPAAPAGGGIPRTIDIGGQSVEISRVAQGFGSGLLQGVGDTIQGMGGVQALVGGTATMPMSGMPVARSNFDDGLGGGATGLGAGLGGGGVLLASMLIANPSGTPAVAQPPVAPPAPAPPVAPVPEMPQVPGMEMPMTPEIPAGQPAIQPRTLGLVPRQDPAIDVDVSQGFNLSVIINAGTVSMALQGAVDALTCQGFGGGLGNILLGLISSKTIPLDALSNSDMGATMDVIQQVIPTGTIELKNEGNVYRIEGQKLRDSVSGNLDVNGAVAAIKVNGMGLGAFIAFAVIHILFAIVAFINVLPLALGFESLRNLLLRARLTQVLPKIPQWTHMMWLFVIAPSLPIVFIFGVVMYGSSAHFRTAHGIISLITTIVGLVAVALHMVMRAGAAKAATGGTPPTIGPFSLVSIRGGVNQVFLLLAVLSTTTGFKDLSSVALCFTQVIPFDIAISIGFGLSTVFVLGSTLMGLDMFLVFRDGRKKKKALKEKEARVEQAVDAESNVQMGDRTDRSNNGGPEMI